VEQQPLHVAQSRPPLIGQSRARGQLLCGVNTGVAGFAVLQSGEVDLLARNTTVTLTRGAASISPPSITMTVRASW
jgi:hypothetical protein